MDQDAATLCKFLFYPADALGEEGEGVCVGSVVEGYLEVGESLMIVEMVNLG